MDAGHDDDAVAPHHWHHLGYGFGNARRFEHQIDCVRTAPLRDSVGQRRFGNIEHTLESHVAQHVQPRIVIAPADGNTRGSGAPGQHRDPLTDRAGSHYQNRLATHVTCNTQRLH